MIIREAQSTDWPLLWSMIAAIFERGDTYAFDLDMESSAAYAVWMDAPIKTFIALDEHQQMIGTYYIKANNAGNGRHVCNCGYIVSPLARGKGIATQLCEHSQNQAVILGFRAMQFNSVVASNRGAVRLWQKLGFVIVGTVPEAFNHPEHGYVDVFIMYKKLANRNH